MTLGYAQHELAEVGRHHPRVPAKLVDLVRRGLHEEVARTVKRLQHRGLEDARVRGADRVDTDGLTTLVPSYGIQHGTNHCAHTSPLPLARSAWRHIAD